MTCFFGYFASRCMPSVSSESFPSRNSGTTIPAAMTANREKTMQTKPVLVLKQLRCFPSGVSSVFVMVCPLGTFFKLLGSGLAGSTCPTATPSICLLTVPAASRSPKSTDDVGVTLPSKFTRKEPPESLECCFRSEFVCLFWVVACCSTLLPATAPSLSLSEDIDCFACSEESFEGELDFIAAISFCFECGPAETSTNCLSRPWCLVEDRRLSEDPFDFLRL
mmetsp:Transcript_75614/g.113917  ORF Transcript_75614/g.113917 Transcript_75614/m.113917 type:complete len:222 (-) Transcript_75614:322-987(-)